MDLARISSRSCSAFWRSVSRRIADGLLRLAAEGLLSRARLLLHAHHLGVALAGLLVLGGVAFAGEFVLVLLHLRVLLRAGLVRLAILLAPLALRGELMLRGGRLHLRRLGHRLLLFGHLLRVGEIDHLGEGRGDAGAGARVSEPTRAAREIREVGRERRVGTRDDEIAVESIGAGRRESRRAPSWRGPSC